MEQETYPERLLPMDDVEAMTGKKRATIYRDIALGRFPAPVKSGGSSRWLLSELLGYIGELKAMRDGMREPAQ
ncbi:helix-turn-helix transcriptional regulator [Pukyongiella litopenaei]|uniref:AlpA family phage regulatory protein n=1 Tax=Pukyongiella litopenaei TaxID=2605946 RepID=A0A2S0MQ07_9RHOB|nr:AlpA family phage regulatory protein [Pukyongiella litopenaei]AVO37927.1 AlpA family phage regulatory protein [Pukyongiella litopenaei]